MLRAPIVAHFVRQHERSAQKRLFLSIKDVCATGDKEGCVSMPCTGFDC